MLSWNTVFRRFSAPGHLPMSEGALNRAGAPTRGESSFSARNLRDSKMWVLAQTTTFTTFVACQRSR